LTLIFSLDHLSWHQFVKYKIEIPNSLSSRVEGNDKMAGMKALWWATVYVIVPIFSGFVWLGMLLGMLLWWAVKENSVHLVGMSATQDIAFVKPPFPPSYISHSILTR
jgi:hypothetical protein